MKDDGESERVMSDGKQTRVMGEVGCAMCVSVCVCVCHVCVRCVCDDCGRGRMVMGKARS